jgi:hypothetical protein
MPTYTPPGTVSAPAAPKVQARRDAPIPAAVGASEIPARIVCQFSCGAASAVAAKLTLAQHPDAILVNAYIENECEDNRRFLIDCERWLDRTITVLRDVKYGANIITVFRTVGYIKGPHGAACTSRIKRGLLREFELPGDVLVLGFTAEEQDRYDDWLERWPDRPISVPLIERGLTKDDCKAMVLRAGIELPKQYRRGYANANCKTCVKGGLAYFRAVREDFPDEFEELCSAEDYVASLHGDNARILRHRSGPLDGQRFALRDLPDGPIDRNDAPPECGLFCASAEQEYAA